MCSCCGFRFVSLMVSCAVVLVFAVSPVGAQDCPELVGHLVGGHLSHAHDVAVSGTFAYVAGSGLVAIDVSSPSTPVEVGFADIPEQIGIAISDGYAFVVFWDGLRVVDVSTPSAPVEVVFADLLGLAIALEDDYAYIAGSGLVVVDVSTPSAPVEVGNVSTPGFSAWDVATSGDYAYVANGDAGLRMIDVSSPSAPVEVGFFDTSGNATGVAVSNGFAYVADGTEGLRVIDVRSPTTPVEVGYLEVYGVVQDVAVSGHFAYLTDSLLGLRVIDVSTPSAPVEVGSFPTGTEADAAERVTVSGGYVYLASGEGGLYIFTECAGGPVPDEGVAFIPAAAYAQGAQGAFFQTDGVINNTGTADATVTFGWLPRGEDNSEFVTSDPITLAPGQSMQFENILNSIFGAESDVVGAVVMTADSTGVIGMTRTYNIPGGKMAGTFGQALPPVPADQFIPTGEKQRIIFMSENDDFRANVGCVNGLDTPLRISIELFNAEGTSLEIKTMDLAPWSNDQINRVFRSHRPVDGYLDVWTDTAQSSFYCYGSVLDNQTSDPTTVLPQVPVDTVTVIPAAALAAGAQGAFFQTDVDINNAGPEAIDYWLWWLPRGENPSSVRSDRFTIGAGAGARHENVLAEVFGLEPDSVGAMSLTPTDLGLLAMTRTYNIPGAKVAGTFGQALPGVPRNQMIPPGTTRRIIFMNENDDTRANLGCINLYGESVRITIDMYDSDGQHLETKFMDLGPTSNNQINRLFRHFAPVNGYVDISATAPGPSFYCYGSVLDNVTSDPTTILPQ